MFKQKKRSDTQLTVSNSVTIAIERARQAVEVALGDHVVFLEQNIKMGAPKPYQQMGSDQCREIEVEIKILPRYLSGSVERHLELKTSLRVVRGKECWEIELDKLFSFSLRAHSIPTWSRTFRVRWEKPTGYTDCKTPLCLVEELRGGPNWPTLSTREAFPSDEVPDDAKFHQCPRSRVRSGYNHSETWNLRTTLAD